MESVKSRHDEADFGVDTERSRLTTGSSINPRYAILSNRNPSYTSIGTTTIVGSGFLPDLPDDMESVEALSGRGVFFATLAARRRYFLLLTEPEASVGSATFFAILVTVIVISNVIMILQTMDAFQYTPTDCRSCGGDSIYIFDDDTFVDNEEGSVPCVCPPSPLPVTNQMLDILLYFLTLEWCFRVVLFVPADPAATRTGRIFQWLSFLASTTTWVDALGIFPYYLENLPSTLVSLRLVRLFRIFQLVRLGQYNAMFLSLKDVMQKSMQYLKLLMLILAFGAAVFGSMVYWLEKGSWKFNDDLQEYHFMRSSLDGSTEEISPFHSIPSGFWWFLVTATTVGYGDLYPTSTGGKFCAAVAALMGLLVIAFPVSVFSNLWSRELRTVDGFDHAALIASQRDSLLKRGVLPTVKKRPVSVVRSAESTPGACMKDPNTTSGLRPAGDDMIQIRSRDLHNIHVSLQLIREHEHRIREILDQYDVNLAR